MPKYVIAVFVFIALRFFFSWISNEFKAKKKKPVKSTKEDPELIYDQPTEEINYNFHITNQNLHINGFSRSQEHSDHHYQQ